MFHQYTYFKTYSVSIDVSTNNYCAIILYCYRLNNTQNNTHMKWYKVKLKIYKVYKIVSFMYFSHFT